MKLAEVEVEFTETADSPPDGWVEGTRSFHADVYFTVGGKEWSERFEYHQGPGITGDPEAASLLSCLASDAQCGDETFKDFCDDFGYDTDSRKAFAQWEACRASVEKLQAVFGSRFDEFCETDWDDV